MKILRTTLLGLVLVPSLALAADKVGIGGARPMAGAAKKPTAAEAKAFVEKTNADLKRLWTKAGTAEWIKSTYITDDTERNAAWANEEVMAYLSTAVPEAAKFDGVQADAETLRMLKLIKLASTLPAPKDAAKRAELAATAAKLEGLYGKGRACLKTKKGKCLDLEELTILMAESRKPDELLEAWTGWHAIAKEMKPLYAREVALANEGAKELGFENVGDLWRSGYDMTPAEFEKETDRLWEQVKPLYQDLHCYVREKLSAKYGEKVVPKSGPIPAHLLGNMWAQDWGNVYPLVEPYKGQPTLDVTPELKKQKWDAVRMVKLGESFFTSLGFDPLPPTFWERSMLTKPQDRAVVCHASAWDVTFERDLRIKMCVKQTEEDLVVIHHELGHNYYYDQYYKLPVLFQQGAHDGFHEAIGDAIALSITPGYLKKVGLLKKVPTDQKGTINVQMKDALGKIAFLPFGKLIDQWRWDVYAGKTKPEAYNAAWWELRKKYQGVAAPVARTEADFDPGAKYHVPGNVPYTRYFLAHILQYQFHRALCQAAGHKGPLHECSIHDDKAAGAKLRAMLALGASKPWPDALEAMTGTRQMDATAILEYFAPLQTWLKEQNKGKQCGW